MGFEILEHTADVGIRARGGSLEELFEQATFGLLDIQGTWVPDEQGDGLSIELEAPDVGALLVDWLDEVIYVHDARDALVSAVELRKVSASRASGVLTLVPRGDRRPMGTAVKAATFHRLKVVQDGDEWLAEVYVDV